MTAAVAGVCAVLDDGTAVARGDCVPVEPRAARNPPVATLEAAAASRVVDQGA